MCVIYVLPTRAYVLVWVMYLGKLLRVFVCIYIKGYPKLLGCG